MSVRTELRYTGEEMLRVATDFNEERSDAPAYGAFAGIAAGTTFMITVLGVGNGSSPWRAQALQDEISGLQQAKSQLTGPSQTLKANRDNINQAIAHKRVEIQQATPPKKSIGEAATDIASPILGGAAIGAFVFTAVAARVRIARRDRAARKSLRPSS